MKLEKSCLHCGEDFKLTKNIEENFCCLGCDSAYKLVDEFNLTSYYKSRILDGGATSLKPQNIQEIELKSFIEKNNNNEFELFAAIDGVSCAACVWLIENILRQQKNVLTARVNLSKKYLRLRWRGCAEYADELVKIIQKLGYKVYPFDEELIKAEEKKYTDKLVKKLAVAGFGTGNIMLFSVALWFYDVYELGHQTRNLMHFLTAIISIPCIIYSSSEFFISAFRALKNKKTNMDVTISTAIGLTVMVSFYQIFHDVEHVYFDSAMTLCFFLLIGKYFDFQARKKAFDVSREFSLLSSSFARTEDEDGQIKIIAAKDIKKNTIILVQVGEKIPADGVVIQGQSLIDNSIITGESKPCEVKNGDEVFAGAINLSCAVRIKASHSQKNSLLKQIQEIIANSENYKNKFVRIADKIAGSYTLVVHLVALIAFLFWLTIMRSGIEQSLLIAISTLVITCPCALALAVPIAQSLTISCGLKNGIIIKSGEVIEKINQISHFIFDKTGTVTYGKPQVTEFKCLSDNITKKERHYYLQIAASLASNSSHPYSRSILQFFGGKKLNILAKEERGEGLSGKYQNKIAKIGNLEFVKKNIAQKYLEKIDKNFSSSFFFYDNKIFVFYFKDKIKKDANYFFKKMNKSHKNLILLSGDGKEIVAEVAKELNFNEYFYEKNPLEKIKILKNLQKNKVKFAMVGDGINDAAAMSYSDLSISFSSASNLTQNVADVIINREDLTPILDLISLSRKSIKIIKQNLLFCLIYNCVAIPFAVLGLVNPLIAAIAMSSSSLIVVINSLRIKNFLQNTVN